MVNPMKYATYPSPEREIEEIAIDIAKLIRGLEAKEQLCNALSTLLAKYRDRVDRALREGNYVEARRNVSKMYMVSDLYTHICRW
ncbi:MAG: hypothetical protein DRN49_00800 [Thaumarchaeota archaeon]|nr:MAG: hypothetical protein DRN49_00800 [Nitrososphaerota archaeon]